ncbi:MAG: hypothetical protein ABS81_01805 [Pseudonocardia sp. SCN 72-86]|nr:MAG: hypothetical protein ABS81_01805 [Pseudonocardia sp. SCN 72-86]
MRRPLVFNAFTMNTPSHMMSGTWVLPDNRAREYADMSTWLDLARTLERGCFDAVFIADGLGVYDTYTGSRDPAVELGVQFPANDPSLLIPAMAAVTENLGFAFTSSVMQEHPYNFARRVSTLDHLTGGRVAWNIVTSYQESAARNFGFDALLTGDERYAWAEEYVDVVYKLWEASWEDDAVLRDTVRGRYADPSKVHEINHVGSRYRVAGPHSCEPSPQRTPVLYQAGSSSTGRGFAGRHAEGTFLNAPRAATASIVRDVRAKAVDAGRQAGDVLAVQMVSIVLGDTEEAAQANARELDEIMGVEGLLIHMSGNVGVDLSSVALDRKLGELRPEEIKTQAVRSMIDGSGLPRSATFRELGMQLGRGLRVVGTPEQVADELESWAVEGDLDGFGLMFATTPGSFEEFVDQVAPHLQERGLMQKEYSPGTMREKLFPGNGPRLSPRHPAKRVAAGLMSSR